MINFHIGLNKTGTTAIQDYCFTNRAEMRNSGLLYPDVLCVAGNGHHPLADYLNSEEGNADIDAQLQSAISFSGDVLFSSELLQTVRDLTVLRQIVGSRDVRVIVYLRDPITYMLSWWQEDIKSDRIACSFDTYASFYWKSYYAVLRRWADAFGSDSIDARIYERALFPERDIITDFVAAIGRQDLGVFPRRDCEINQSISGNLLFAKLIYNSMGLPDASSAELSAGLSEIANMRPAFTMRPQVNAETAARIESWYVDDLNRVANEFKLNVPVSSRIDGTLVPNLETLADDLEFICEEADKRGLGISKLRKLLGIRRNK